MRSTTKCAQSHTSDVQLWSHLKLDLSKSFCSANRLLSRALELALNAAQTPSSIFQRQIKKLKILFQVLKHGPGSIHRKDRRIPQQEGRVYPDHRPVHRQGNLCLLFDARHPHLQKTCRSGTNVIRRFTFVIYELS